LDHQTPRPFVFTGWLKLSNILALAAAQREDLVVSHVAFVVASRLLWCAEGIRGAEINVEVPGAWEIPEKTRGKRGKMWENGDFTKENGDLEGFKLQTW